MKVIKYPSLNGLRAISILMVIMHHLGEQYNFLNDIPNIHWLNPVLFTIQDGHMGVNVFFVISGFLITSLMLQEEEHTKSVSLKNFYIRRTLRIFPAYYFMLLIYFFLNHFDYIYISNASWLTALTYTKYFNWTLDWYTSHAWSLSVEEHFYLFWPLMFIAGKKFRNRAAISLILIVPVIRTALHFHPINWMDNGLTIFTRIDSIATGCFVALYKDEIIEKIKPHLTKLFFISILGLFFLRDIAIQTKKIHLGFVFIPLGKNDGTIANFLIAVVMIYSVFGPKGWWFKFLNLRVINFIGLLSYSIYLWQQIFLHKSGYWVNQMPQNLLFVLLMALFSYYLIEKPFLKLKSRFSDSKE